MSSSPQALIPTEERKDFMAEHRTVRAFFVLLILTVTADAAIDPGDLTVMLALAKSIGADVSKGWSAGTDPCTDWGKGEIACNSGGHVTNIQIKSVTVTAPSGYLPDSLANLTALTRLELNSLMLTGPLPSLSSLSSLQALYLHDNLLSSIPPNFFSGMTSLTSVYLDNNPFAPWPIPESITDCSGLQQFSAMNASVNGEIPGFLASLASLQVLRLSNNLLVGGIPSSFSGSSISLLWLNNQKSDDTLSGRIDVIANMTSLTNVSLQSNSFSGPLPDFSQLVNLLDLSLRDNQLTGPVPESLTKLSTLKHVVLTNNLLQGPAPKFADGVTVDMNPIGERFCHNSPDPCDPRVNVLLSVAASVEYPINFANSWKGNDPCASWLGISCDRNGNIVTVNFKKQSLTGVISPHFEELESLVNLDLSGNNLSGTIPPGLVNLKSLKKLDVSNNNISGQVPSFGSGVTVITDGNQNIGKDIVPGTPGGGLTPGSSSEGSDSGKSSGGRKTSTGVVVGSVCGGIVVLGVLGLVGFCFLKKRRRNYGRPPNVVIHPNHSGSDPDMLKVTVGLNGCIANGSVPMGNINVVEPVNMVIKIQLLREVTNNFSPDNILGRGGFGTVYGGQLHDGTLIAVKRMESGAIGSKGTNEFKSEISVLTKVRHRHLVSLLGYCLEENEKILVYEYMPQGTLSRHLFNWSKAGLKPLEWMRRLSIALDVARGVEYLHSLANQTFIHRDLKPSNILLGDNMRAKVADFGLVRLAPEGKQVSVETRLAGTFGYLAPEYAVTGRVTTKADVFSFGVILMELLTGRKALDESQTEENIHLVSWFRRMHHSEDTFPKAIDPTINTDEKEIMSSVLLVSELASHCCARDPHQRPDMGYAVNILSSLVEHWNPSDYNRNDNEYGIDLNMTLQQAVSQWQASDSSSQTGSDRPLMYSGGNDDNTLNSIPTLPGSFAAETYSGR